MLALKNLHKLLIWLKLFFFLGNACKKCYANVVHWWHILRSNRKSRFWHLFKRLLEVLLCPEVPEIVANIANFSRPLEIDLEVAWLKIDYSVTGADIRDEDIPAIKSFNRVTLATLVAYLVVFTFASILMLTGVAARKSFLLVPW